eukprot:scaffold4855_cov99-Cylindrotheca_fusiformis.AAC.1
MQAARPLISRLRCYWSLLTILLFLSSSTIRQISSQEITIPECGAILGTLTAQELKTILISTSGIPVEAAGLGTVLVENDIQIRKICASCQDFTALDNSDYDDFCGPDAYGCNATVSGMLVLPIDSDSGNIIAGSIAGHIDAPRTITTLAEEVPSRSFEYYNQHWLAFLGASSGKVAIRPDYLGYGESNETFFKSMLIRPAYPTATIPLWRKAVQIVQEESDCRSYLKPNAYVTGYGEGAYAAVSIADALSKALQVSIVEVSAGGGPYRTGSVTVPRMMAGIRYNTFPSSHNYVFAMLASAYSSTNPWPANYNQGQDFLNAITYRDFIVTLVQEEETLFDLELELPPTIFDIVNSQLLNWILSEIESDNYAPCLSGPDLDPDLNTFFCEALLQSDLTSVLEEAAYVMAAGYKIELCHSSNDDVYHVSNLPDFDSNSQLTEQLTTGSHDDAYNFCSEMAVQGLYTNVNLDPITECVPNTESPTLAPTTSSSTSLQPTYLLSLPTTEPTPAPTPKPTTKVVEAPPTNSAAIALGWYPWRFVGLILAASYLFS